MARELSGHWQLIEIAGGWKSVAQKLLHKIELTLDQRGQGLIYQDGQFRSRYQLTLTYWWGWVRTTIFELGEKPFLNFSPSRRGFLKLCEQFLILDQDVGDGDIYVFKRVSSSQKKS